MDLLHYCLALLHTLKGAVDLSRDGGLFLIELISPFEKSMSPYSRTKLEPSIIIIFRDSVFEMTTMTLSMY